VKIVINRDWRIITDPEQFVVQQRRTVKGRDKWDCRAFHRTLDGAVLQLARQQVYDFEGGIPPMELEALCHALDSLKGEILAALGAAGLIGLKPSDLEQRSAA